MLRNKVFFCLKLKISITTEPIEISLLGKLYRGTGMVVRYFMLIFKSSDGFRVISDLVFSIKTEPLDAVGTATSVF